MKNSPEVNSVLVYQRADHFYSYVAKTVLVREASPKTLRRDSFSERWHMRNVKFVVREVIRGGRSLEEIFAAVILRDTALTAGAESDIIESTKQSQDSLCSGKGAVNGT